MITDRFWFDVTNNREKDEFGMLQPQGRVQMSFELVPEEDAKKEFENGFGRSEPNVYPTLSDPEGRLQFDFLNPLSFIKQIVGINGYLLRSEAIREMVLSSIDLPSAGTSGAVWVHILAHSVSSQDLMAMMVLISVDE